MDTSKLAFTDIETTGLDPAIHEIIELGLVINGRKFNWKIKPENIEAADSIALKVNGYNEEDWKDAITLKQAMKEYMKKTINLVFVARNVTFDWGFMEVALKKTGIKNEMHYHKLCTMSMAFIKGFNPLSLKKVCEALNIPPEPDVHRAVNGANSAYQIFMKMNNGK